MDTTYMHYMCCPKNRKPHVDRISVKRHYRHHNHTNWDMYYFIRDVTFISSNISCGVPRQLQCSSFDRYVKQKMQQHSFSQCKIFQIFNSREFQQVLLYRFVNWIEIEAFDSGKNKFPYLDSSQHLRIIDRNSEGM